MSPLHLSGLRSRNSRRSLGSSQFEDADDLDSYPSPKPHRHSGKLLAFIDKLKPGKSSGGGGIKDGASRHSSDGFTHPDPHGKTAKGTSRIGSGKHTPNREEARGDFGKFLKAAELQERLEREQMKEAEEELKAAKLKKKKGGKSVAFPSSLTHKRSSASDEVGPPPQRLEERKLFPGAFDDLEADDEEEEEKEEEVRTKDGAGAARNSPSSGFRPSLRPSNSDPTSSNQSFGVASEPRTSSYFGICGTVSDDNASQEEQPSPEARDGEHDEGTTLVDETYEIPRRRPASGVSFSAARPASSASSFSSTGSIADRQAAEALEDISEDEAPQQRRERSASTRSLKSWRSTDSPGGNSFASGGANRKLSAPLLELEELELKSFLRNFNRHTREVRVPASVHFPRKRMPRWEDFRIPPDEAAIAAREGKRVTVLTHVDRGLQALARLEGAGVPQPRSTSGTKSATKSKKTSSSKKKEKEGHSSGIEDEDDGPSRQPTLKWSPQSGFVPQGLSTGLPSEGKDDEVQLFGNSLSARILTEKNERAAKQLEKSNQVPSPDAQPSLGGKGTPLPLKAFKDSVDELRPGLVDIHDADIEYRPDANAEALTDGAWELIDEQGERLASVDPNEGERVDGVAFCIAYILALVERYAPEELDNTTDQTYREGKARSHLERLYLIAPFWERLGFGIRRLYRWDDPRRTATAAMIYFVLWWTDLLPTAFFLSLMYYILQFRFFPPEASFLHEQVRARMARGVEADRLAERLRRRSRLDILEIYRRFTLKYGSAVQLAAGDIADFHEKVKNLILWRNPQATWRTFTFFAVITIMVTFLPAYYIWKTGFFFLGFTFFCLLPLQSHYPRYRRPLSPIWWALWGAPTDGQFAIQLLRRRQLEKASGKVNGSREGTNGKKRTSKFRRSEAAHAVKGGAMRPMNEEEGTLWGLEEEVEGSKGSDGEKRFRPKKLGSFFCQHRGVPG